MSDLRWLWTLPLLAATAAVRPDDGPAHGTPLSAEDVAAIASTILPDGTGLPPGRGDAVTGAVVYGARCQACHGAGGRGGPNDALVGGRGSLAGDAPLKTVGSYWPYATTVFDYVRRAMPYNEPGSLSADDVYAVTAYLLKENGIIDEATVLNADTLPAVEMPNRNGFRRAWARETDHP